MKPVHGYRVILTLLVAVLLPLAISRCALMPLQAASAAGAMRVAAPAHDDGDHDGCTDSTPANGGCSHSQGCCCDDAPSVVTAVQAGVMVAAPGLAHQMFASPPPRVACTPLPDAFARPQCDQRSLAPPGAVHAPQAPRSPPRFA